MPHSLDLQLECLTAGRHITADFFTAQAFVSRPRPELSRFRGESASGPSQAAGLSHSYQLGRVSWPPWDSGSARLHLVGPHLGEGTVHTTPALHFRAVLSSPPTFSPPARTSAAFQGLPALRMHKRSLRHGSEAERLASAVRIRRKRSSYQARRRTLT